MAKFKLGEKVGILTEYFKSKYPLAITYPTTGIIEKIKCNSIDENVVHYTISCPMLSDSLIGSLINPPSTSDLILEEVPERYIYNLAQTTMTLSAEQLAAIGIRSVSNTCSKTKTSYPKPDRIIYNDPATIVFWKDGTKTIVKCAKGEKFNKYNAFCAALAKKIFENNSRVHKIVEKGEDQRAFWTNKKERKHQK